MTGSLQQPETSIIMGVYNIEQFDISKMMDSILQQTYQDFEFIICDDGSEDNTYHIIKSYTTKDSRIRILRHSENMGLAFTLNHCLSYARGQFIARQDADDISAMNRLEKQINFLKEKTNVDFVGSNVFLFSDSGVWGQRKLKEFPKKQDMLFCSPFIHGTIVIRKSFLLKVQGYRTLKVTKRAEDYDLFMRLYAEGIIGANLQEALYYYKEDANNMAKRKYSDRIDEAKVRLMGFKRLGLLPLGLIFVIKPLIVGLMPKKILFVWKCKTGIFQKDKMKKC